MPHILPQKIYTNIPIEMLVLGEGIFTSDTATSVEFHPLNCPLIRHS